MKQFTNHGWSYAQLTQIFQNDSSPCRIAEKREKLQSHDICGCLVAASVPSGGTEDTLQKVWTALYQYQLTASGTI